ncbi:MAG: archease [Gammaproteobacteria bacterium]|nr:MAG: archease [Gammaproteobacteria bacterium]
MAPHWSHFEHEADIGVRGCGPTVETAFEQAALALTAVITDLENVADTHTISIQCQAPDIELLLVDWLNAIIYEMATRKWLFARFQVDIKDRRLQATAWGEAVDIARHAPAVEPKGATYTMLKVTQQHDEYCAQCVVDV